MMSQHRITSGESVMSQYRTLKHTQLCHFVGGSVASIGFHLTAGKNVRQPRNSTKLRSHWKHCGIALGCMEGRQEGGAYLSGSSNRMVAAQWKTILIQEQSFSTSSGLMARPGCISSLLMATIFLWNSGSSSRTRSNSCNTKHTGHPPHRNTIRAPARANTRTRGQTTQKHKRSNTFSPSIQRLVSLQTASSVVQL